MYLQDTWDNASYTSFFSTPVGVDPAFIAIYDDTLGVIGAGGSGYSALYSFDPDDTLSVFSNIGTNYNFQGVFSDSGSLLVNGASWTQPTNAVYYMTLSGGTSVLLLTDAGMYSAGLANDTDGNLYVANNDDGVVYKFTALQLEAAITSAPLSLGDAEFVHDFGDGGNVGSIAVDGLGRIWTAGWNQEGLKVYNPALDQEFTYIPGLTNTNYKVATFALGGTNYIAYLNQANPGQSGTEQTYGFDLAELYAIPEPGTLGLFALTGSIFGALFIMRKLRSTGWGSDDPS